MFQIFYFVISSVFAIEYIKYELFNGAECSPAQRIGVMPLAAIGDCRAVVPTQGGFYFPSCQTYRRFPDGCSACITPEGVCRPECSQAGVCRAPTIIDMNVCVRVSTFYPNQASNPNYFKLSCAEGDLLKETTSTSFGNCTNKDSPQFSYYPFNTCLTPVEFQTGTVTVSSSFVSRRSNNSLDFNLKSWAGSASCPQNIVPEINKNITLSCGLIDELNPSSGFVEYTSAIQNVDSSSLGSAGITFSVLLVFLITVFAITI